MTRAFGLRSTSRRHGQGCRRQLPPAPKSGHGGAMEYQLDSVSAYDNDDGQRAVNKVLEERLAGGWELHSHSVVNVESTGQFEYLPQGHALFTHFFIFRR